jgi:hypothetical protein
MGLSQADNIVAGVFTRASTSVIAINLAGVFTRANLDPAWIILCSAFPDSPAPSPRCVPQVFVPDLSPVVYYVVLR